MEKVTQPTPLYHKPTTNLLGEGMLVSSQNTDLQDQTSNAHNSKMRTLEQNYVVSWNIKLLNEIQTEKDGRKIHVKTSKQVLLGDDSSKKSFTGRCHIKIPRSQIRNQRPISKETKYRQIRLASKLKLDPPSRMSRTRFPIHNSVALRSNSLRK